MADNEMIKLKPSEVVPFLVTCYEAGLVAMLHGKPGIGKSKLVFEAANVLRQRYKKFEVIDKRICTMEPTDIAGVPWPDAPSKKTTWCLPEFLMDLEPDWRGLLFFDEFAQGLLATQNSASQLILDKHVNGHPFPAGGGIVLASNRKSDKAGITELASHMKNRLIHIEVVEDHKDWLVWANKSGMRPEIIGFMMFKPKLLCVFDNNSHAFPTPRTWEFTSKWLDKCETENVSQIVLNAGIAGAVGQGAATEFLGFLKIFRSLPALDDIIKRPEKAEIFSDPSTAYALCLCLARKVDEKNIDQVIVYLERNQPEIMATCMKEILKRRAAIKDTPAFKAWHKKYPNLDI